MVSQEDIELAEEVRKYPALYDKSCVDYHKNDVVKNCWERVQLILGMESGEVAKKNFILLRKRFNKAREKQKKGMQSGTSRDEMILKCGDGYKFLSWLIPFIVQRQTKSNLSTSIIVEGVTASSNDNNLENAPGGYTSANNMGNSLESSDDDEDDEDDSLVFGENENVFIVKRPNFCLKIPPLLPEAEGVSVTPRPGSKKTKVVSGKS